jgi:hypothetical protein
MAAPTRFYDNVGLPRDADGSPAVGRAGGNDDDGPSPTSPAGAPQMARSPSVGAFLDLREVNIADDPPRGGGSEGRAGNGGGASGSGSGNGGGESSNGGGGGGAGDAADATTPRAAPCIALPKQNAELLRHFAIGAAPASLHGRGPYYVVRVRRV